MKYIYITPSGSHIMVYYELYIHDVPVEICFIYRIPAIKKIHCFLSYVQLNIPDIFEARQYIKLPPGMHFLLSTKVTTLEAEGKVKDEKITTMEKRITQLESTIDDLEQHGRRESMRIFGLPEDDPGTTDEKVLKPANERMELRPPLQLDEIAVWHRVGLPQTDPQDDNADPPPPRPLLVKFVRRRSKERVMAERKKLRNRRPRTMRPNQEDVTTNEDLPET